MIFADNKNYNISADKKFITPASNHTDRIPNYMVYSTPSAFFEEARGRCNNAYITTSYRHSPNFYLIT